MFKKWEEMAFNDSEVSINEQEQSATIKLHPSLRVYRDGEESRGSTYQTGVKGKTRDNKHTPLLSWKQKVYSCLKLHNYHKEDFSVQGVVWLESNTKHL